MGRKHLLKRLGHKQLREQGHKQRLGHKHLLKQEQQEKEESQTTKLHKLIALDYYYVTLGLRLVKINGYVSKSFIHEKLTPNI